MGVINTLLWSRKKVGLVAVSLIGSQNAIGIYSC